jgi:hypothetical protein
LDVSIATAELVQARPERSLRDIFVVDAQGARGAAELQTGYDAPLVLLCHCDLSEPSSWCHRTMLAESITQETGEEIPEVE